MEKHFLADLIESRPVFKAEPWYNSYGDCIVYKMVDEAVVAERVDELLTVYRSAIDGRSIGFQIKDVQAILRKFGFDGLAVSTRTEKGCVKSISIGMLLLAAYEDGRKSMNRRRGYAAASVPPGLSIPLDQLRVSAAVVA